MHGCWRCPARSTWGKQKCYSSLLDEITTTIPLPLPSRLYMGRNLGPAAGQEGSRPGKIHPGRAEITRCSTEGVYRSNHIAVGSGPKEDTAEPGSATVETAPEGVCPRRSLTRLWNTSAADNRCTCKTFFVIQRALVLCAARRSPFRPSFCFSRIQAATPLATFWWRCRTELLDQAVTKMSDTCIKRRCLRRLAKQVLVGRWGVTAPRESSRCCGGLLSWRVLLNRSTPFGVCLTVGKKTSPCLVHRSVERSVEMRIDVSERSGMVGRKSFSVGDEIYAYVGGSMHPGSTFCHSSVQLYRIVSPRVG